MSQDAPIREDRDKIARLYAEAHLVAIQVCFFPIYLAISEILTNDDYSPVTLGEDGSLCMEPMFELLLRDITQTGSGAMEQLKAYPFNISCPEVQAIISKAIETMEESIVLSGYGSRNNPPKLQ